MTTRQRRRTPEPSSDRADTGAATDVRVRPVSVTEAVPLVLLVVAAGGCWWTQSMAGHAGHMGTGQGIVSLGRFLAAWTVMMVAMMFPAIWPAVQLYVRAAATGRVAAVPWFLLGYVVVWGVVGVPGYVGWRILPMPGSDAPIWLGYVGGAVLVAAGIWQLSDLKATCLRHCRSPISFFMQYGGRARRATGAIDLGARHGLYCLGCCWALMAVLVSVGTMHLAWMAGLSVLIFVEKVVPRGELVGRVAGLGFAALGLLLLTRPGLLDAVT